MRSGSVTAGSMRSGSVTTGSMRSGSIRSGSMLAASATVFFSGAAGTISSTSGRSSSAASLRVASASMAGAGMLNSMIKLSMAAILRLTLVIISFPSEIGFSDRARIVIFPSYYHVLKVYATDLTLSDDKTVFEEQFFPAGRFLLLLKAFPCIITCRNL